MIDSKPRAKGWNARKHETLTLDGTGDAVVTTSNMADLQQIPPDQEVYRHGRWGLIATTIAARGAAIIRAMPNFSRR
ncbi:hypothetical protein [Tateyamaria sp.]|uniref:hypothetical protein n=1 Tax=Tateyamaria sp. TaxID=1929288 RepID=UPI003B210770